MNSPPTQHRQDAAPPGGESFWEFYVWHWPLVRRPLLYKNPFLLVLVISVVVAVFEHTRPVVEMQVWSLDWFKAKKQPADQCDYSKDPKDDCSTNIIIVAIDNTDYRDPKLFNAQSPLKPEKVVELVYAALARTPKVLGVDLDTKDPVWRQVIDGLRCHTDSSRVGFSFETNASADGAAASNPASQNASPNVNRGINCLVRNYESKIVWARIPVERPDESADAPNKDPIQMYQLLGGYRIGSDCNSCFGIPRFKLDADGVVRRYEGQFEIEGGQPVRSLARVVAENYCDNGGGCLQTGREEERIFNSSTRKRFRTLTATQLLKSTPEASKKGDSPSWKYRGRQGDFRNKIVLIGGNFEDANDMHDVPGRAFFPQQASGVELTAQAIESDLQGGSFKEVPRCASFVLDLVAGTCFVGIFFWLVEDPPRLIVRLVGSLTPMRWFRFIQPRRVSFYCAMLLTTALAIAASWAILQFGSHWVSFIPILIGVNIHQYIEHAKALGDATP